MLGTVLTQALLRTGHRVTVWNRTAAKADAVAASGATCVRRLPRRCGQPDRDRSRLHLRRRPRVADPRDRPPRRAHAGEPELRHAGTGPNAVRLGRRAAGALPRRRGHDRHPPRRPAGGPLPLQRRRRCVRSPQGDAGRAGPRRPPRRRSWCGVGVRHRGAGHEHGGAQRLLPGHRPGRRGSGSTHRPSPRSPSTTCRSSPDSCPTTPTRSTGVATRATTARSRSTRRPWGTSWPPADVRG